MPEGLRRYRIAFIHRIFRQSGNFFCKIHSSLTQTVKTVL